MHNLSFLLQDIFTFLCQAHAQPLKLVGNHRLAPTAIEQLNALFCVRENIQPKHTHNRHGQWQKNFHPQKSELYTARLRFIHYVCESANLVAPSERQLVPTLQAAAYLAQEPSAQARLLFQSAFPSEPTRAQRERWRKFKMPDHLIGAPQSFAQWLVQILRALSPDQTIKLTTLYKLYRDAERAKQFTPIESDDPADAPENLIRAHLELVQQFDALILHANSLIVTPLGAALLHDTPFTLDTDAFHGESLRWTRSKKNNTVPDLIATARADTNSLWQLTALAEHAATLATPRINRRLYRLDAEKIRRALDNGLNAAAIREFLETITADALPVPVSAWLHQITDGYGKITLRRVTLLETDEPAQLVALTRSKTIRACIQRTLSPRAVVVKPQRVTHLARRLQHRNLHPRLEIEFSRQSSVVSRQSPTTQSPSHPISQFDQPTLAHLYLAARLTQRVQALNSRAYHMPSAIVSELSEKISDPDRDTADALARELAENLTAQKKSRLKASRLEQEPIPAIAYTVALEKIQHALRRRAPLQITYYSPYTDETTTRVIEPLRFQENDNHHYLIAYCHLDQAERTFRIDRILQIADGESQIAKRQAHNAGR